MRKIITAVAAYGVIAILVFGWTYNHTNMCFHGPHPDTQKIGDWCYTEEHRVSNASMVGALWPVIIPIALGIVVFGNGWHVITQAAITITRWP